MHHDSHLDSEKVRYKRIEEELRIKESALDSSINGLAIGDLEGVITYVNEAALQLFGGYKAGEIIGQSALVFAQSEDEAARVFQIVHEKGMWAGEIAGKKKDGSEIFVHLSANIVEDEKGEPVCMMCSFVDVTELKKIETELRIKDNAIASSINGIAIADLEGTVTYVNDTAVRMWGGEATDILGKSALIFAQSKDLAREIFKTIHDEGGWIGEVSGWRKDGSPIVGHLSANLVRNNDGVPICMMCSFVDVTERKRIEEELRIRDYAIASSINGIGIADLEGTITYVNNAALRMWGADDASEVLGKSPLDFAEDKEEAARIFEEFLKNGGWSGEVSSRRKDGSPITLHLTASLVKNDRGEPLCMMDSFVDITERKQVEEELRIKDYAIASSINGIGIAGLEGKITYVNDAALRMWGADDVSEVLGKSPLDFAEDKEDAVRIFEEFIRTGGWSGEVFGRRKDGSPITLHLTASLVKNDRGEPVCMMDSFVDITERKQMEEDLRIKESAINSSINGIAIGDLAGNITYVNDAFLGLWGGSDPAEVLGRSAVTFAQSKEDALVIINTVLTQGNWVGEITGTKKDGTPLSVQLSAHLVENEKGDPVCMMCSFVDITERKEAEEKLQRAYEGLEMRVLERTGELVEANRKLQKEIEERKQVESSLLKKELELELKSLNLEEANTALKVLLKRREQDKDELEEKVLNNIRELIMPGVAKLKSTPLSEKQKIYLDILESNLSDIASPFLQKLSAQYMNMTPTEIQVASLVREGKTTKDIADLLNISERGVEFHRNNIRMKLGLKNRKANLRSYLLSLN